MRRQGGYLFVVTALVLGLGLGLLVSLVISPVTYQNISPAMLKPADKDLYRAMIALSFNARGDMGRAEARLGLLEEADPRSALAAQAQQSIAQGKPADESRSLALLASALGSGASTSSASAPGGPGTEPVEPPGTEPVEVPSFEPVLTLPASIPAVDVTPTLDIPVERPTTPPEEPTAYPSPTPGASYIAKERKGLCDVEYTQTLQVYVVDKDGKSIPGAEIIVTWEAGEEHFFTGMKPAIDLGYADFKMEPDVLYNVRMASGGQTVTKISTPNCITDPGVPYKGGDKVIFGLP